MRKGTFEALPLDLGKKKEELEQAIDKINLTAGIGLAIEKLKYEEERLMYLVRVSGEKGIEAPDGYFFAITARGNTFELSGWIPKSGYEDAEWSIDSPKKFDTERIGDHYVFIASAIGINSEYSSEHPAAAFAYSPDGETRCFISDDRYKVDIVAKGEIPELLINPQPSAEVAVP